MRSSYLEKWNVKAGRAETKKASKQAIEAHLTVAIRRKDYSIALTKCFQNTVKLRGRKNKGLEDERGLGRHRQTGTEKQLLQKNIRRRRSR